MSEVDSFLQRCSASSADACVAFEELLERSSADPAPVRVLLEALIDSWAGMDSATFAETYHFVFRRMSVNTAAEPPQQIVVLEFPSTFSPEAWSFTFYEGLSRYPTDEFQDRRVVELGCGNGWITIALALRYRPAGIIGVDINPRAVLCSRINALINGLDANGEVIETDGYRLLDAVSFLESDLLSAVAGNGTRFDRIIGCIPQVLSPDPEALSDMATIGSSDEDLYALSNYTSAQGFVEDQFGLGLIARAVEEAVDLLRPTGKIVFNIGGRPGRQVLERLFRRRGLLIKPIWQTRVEQAQDTDILSLVEIESSGPHRFEFFMNAAGGEPISASTALRFAEAGGQIHHSLTVYEGQLAFPEASSAILQAIRSEGLEDAHSALDLCFEDREVAEERQAFLADFLSGVDRGCFPYESVQGGQELRRAAANFLQSYFQVAINAEQVFVGVSRHQLLRNLLAIYRPETTLIDERLIRPLGRQDFTRLIDTPPVSDQICRLTRRLGPAAVVLSMTPQDARSPESFRQLVDETAAEGAVLVLDLSDILDLSSTPETNGVFEYLAEHPLPEHVILLCGLIRNRVYEDMEVGLCLSRCARVHAHLAGAAELTYSRAPLISQQFYHRLLADLLYFQRPDRARTLYSSMIESDEVFDPNPHAARAFQHPAVATQALPLGPTSCRMDYGENELNAPAALNSALAEAFVRQNIAPQEVDCDESVRAVVSGRFGAPIRTWGVAFGCGVAPLFSAAMEVCRERDGQLLLPQGAYGQFAACARFHGVKTVPLPTSIEDGFKMTVATVRAAARAVERPWLFLNAPVVNPSGAVYRVDEVEAIVEAARECGATLIIDSVFSGLEVRFAARYEIDHWPSTVILGGLSKEFAAAGLRFGYALTNDDDLLSGILDRRLDQPHSSHFFAVHRLLGKQLAGEPGLVGDLESQRGALEQRADRLMQTLGESGWEPLLPEGGLFCIARPSDLVGRKMAYEGPDGDRRVTLDFDNIAEAAFYATELLFNGPDWTGIPQYCRFVLSVQEPEFERGLEKIRQFYRIAGGAT